MPETYAYWDMDYGVQNEMGLSMAESTCTAKTAGWPATPDKPYGYNRASIEDLTKIALERCATATCAIETMGDEHVWLGGSGCMSLCRRLAHPLVHGALNCVLSAFSFRAAAEAACGACAATSPSPGGRREPAAARN